MERVNKGIPGGEENISKGLYYKYRVNSECVQQLCVGHQISKKGNRNGIFK